MLGTAKKHIDTVRCPQESDLGVFVTADQAYDDCKDEPKLVDRHADNKISSTYQSWPLRPENYQR